MTIYLQDLLRLVCETGIGLEPLPDGRLRTWGKGKLPRDLAEEVRHQSAGVRKALSDDAIRASWPLLPTASLCASLRPLLAWYAIECASFTPDQRELYEERAAIREYDDGAPRWWAEILAVEDIVNEQSNTTSSSIITRAA